MQKSAPERTGPSADESMDKVRELLFGHQIRRIDERLDALDKLIHNSINELRETLRTSQEQSTARLNSETASLDARFQDRVNGLESELTTALQALRHQADQRFDDLDTQLAARHQEMSQALDREGDRLQKAKMERGALAELLEGMARSIRGDGV